MCPDYFFRVKSKKWNWVKEYVQQVFWHIVQNRSPEYLAAPTAIHQPITVRVCCSLYCLRIAKVRECGPRWCWNGGQRTSWQGVQNSPFIPGVMEALKLVHRGEADQFHVMGSMFEFSKWSMRLRLTVSLSTLTQGLLRKKMTWQMTCHSFLGQSNLPSGEETQNLELEWEEGMPDDLLGVGVGAGWQNGEGREWGEPPPGWRLSARLCSWTRPCLLHTTCCTVYNEGQWTGESNDSLTADPSLPVLNPGSLPRIRREWGNTGVSRLFRDGSLGGTWLSSIAQSCPTLCDPMDCSTPGLPVHHRFPELTQTHIHRVGDAIQPSHPLSSPSSPSLNLSQHQGLSQWVSSSHQMAKLLEFQL